jgi:hypothetical protein
LITIFFRNRGEVMQGKKWTPTEDWSMEDTEKLPKHFLEEVEAFMAGEDGAVKTEEDDQEEEAKN